jgi:hypothetical protein
LAGSSLGPTNLPLAPEILDPETALALDQDDAGTLSKTGSIGGVTNGDKMRTKGD